MFKPVLIAEDTVRVRAYLVEQLVDRGFTPISSDNGLQAVRDALEFRPPVLMLDSHLPLMEGLDVVRYLRMSAGEYDPAIVLMSAIHPTLTQRRDAENRFGIKRFLLKPFSDQHFVATLEDAWNDGAKRIPIQPNALALAIAV